MNKNIFFNKRSGLIRIGRKGFNNDLEFAGNSVSRNHCVIKKNLNGTYEITDLNSKNGTFVNGQLLLNKSVIISEFDTISIGSHIFSISGKAPNVAILNFENLEKTYADGNIGFHSLSLSFTKGDFVAIMGPSGCGKSTLLKAITGINPAGLGIIKIDGVDFYKNYHILKSKIGYVPQDDVLHKELTVEQSLIFSIKLWNKERIKDKDIHDKIRSVLLNVNINDSSILKKRISELSGGQRKRIAIATELLFEPSILLLDEPTSPLDPESVSEFLKCIQNLAKNGITVLMVTHKPEDLSYTTKVLFLGKGGYTCFCGSVNDFYNYFHRRKINDIYALLSNVKESENCYKQFNERFRSTNILKKNSGISTNKSKNFNIQLYWLTIRYLKCKTSNTASLLFIILQAPIIALLLTLIFSSVTLGVLFMMVITSIWFGISNAAREIADESSIYEKERMYNLGIIPYILSKLIVLSFLTIIQITLFSFICVVSIKDDSLSINNYPLLWFTIILVSISSIMLGLFLSSIVRSGKQALAYMPLLLIPQVILAGIIEPIKSRIVDLLSCLTFSRWGTQALAEIQGDVMVLNSLNGEFQKMNANRILALPNTFEIGNNIILQDIVFLICLTSILFLGIVICLRRRDAF